ncbi:SRPBCC family protein [Mangrovibrevibacter kandeliae]|uniref:SRPBCC family protein n=1 Tax=Mangrovibrevibacter kandeliae TaxID=2968473 RepID=UPI002118C928|nr:SRPBCC domain-containing protein [Aurantimonas sp. CSK15Z-1]MCQ8780867.1 SRPBCC domain-containing protein [Aurantimonas sp. CSK15Z-1]
MSVSDADAQTEAITLEQSYPHSAAAMWKALTTPELMARWLMEPTGFEPVVGNRFTYRTTPSGPWDGTIHCEVLDVVPLKRLVHSWRGGSAANSGYGSLLDTVVTWTLAQTEGGTLVRVVHSGFRLPRNEFAFRNMSNGWPKVIRRIGEFAGEED